MFNWLVLLLSLATVTRSEHYHIVPVNSTDLCRDYRNGTCFTLEQLVQGDLLSGGDNLTLSFLPGDHVLTEQLLICNFSHVYIIGQSTSTTVVRFHINGAIHFVSAAELEIEHLGFFGVTVRPQNIHQSFIINGARDIYINHCFFSGFKLLNQPKTLYIVNIFNTQAATIESTLFMNNTGQALHVEADDVYIAHSLFTRNDGGAVDIESNNTLINNTEFNYNGAVSGGAVQVVSGSVAIIWCNFTNNKASNTGGAISVDSGSMSVSDCELTNNRAYYSGAIYVKSGSVSISDSTLSNNDCNYGGGAIGVSSGSVSISDSTLSNNSAKEGGAISVLKSNVPIFGSTLSNNSTDNDEGAIYVLSGSVSISNSILTNNSAHDRSGAIFAIGSVSISNSTVSNKAGSEGGAIGIYSGNMSISNSTLTNNSAGYDGGAISVGQGSVSISNSTLTNNSADNDGGAIGVVMGSVSISNSTLTNNIANSGGAMHVNSKSSVIISDSTLTNNRGVFGGAISIIQSQMCINTKGVIITNNTATSGGGGIFLRESTLLVNKPIKINHNTAHQDGGGIYAFLSRVEFQSVSKRIGSNKPSSEIYDNIAENGGGINAVDTTIQLTRSYVNIDKNAATANGGGVYLQHNSKFYLFKEDLELLDPYVVQPYYVKLIINNNSARYGGGIFVADDTQRSACGVRAIETNATQTIFAYCFIQTIKLYPSSFYENPNYFNTFVTNNVATQSGADIYGGLLDRCTADKNAEYHISSTGSDYIKKTVKFSSISSKPVRVILCNNSQSGYIIHTRKGYMIKISVMAVDQVGNPLNATIQSSVITESRVGRLKEGQEEQKIDNQCTELEYNVFSQDSSAQVELYAKGPCFKLGISKQLINISFLPCACAIGLKPIQSNIECK